MQHKAAGLVGSALASAQASWGGRVCGWCAAGQAGKSKAWLGRLAQQHQVFKSLLHLMACCIATRSCLGQRDWRNQSSCPAGCGGACEGDCWRRQGGGDGGELALPTLQGFTLFVGFASSCLEQRQLVHGRRLHACTATACGYCSAPAPALPHMSMCSAWWCPPSRRTLLPTPSARRPPKRQLRVRLATLSDSCCLCRHTPRPAKCLLPAAAMQACATRLLP